MEDKLILEIVNIKIYGRIGFMYCNIEPGAYRKVKWNPGSDVVNIIHLNLLVGSICDHLENKGKTRRIEYAINGNDIEEVYELRNGYWGWHKKIEI